MTVRQFPILHHDRIREPKLAVPVIKSVPWDFVQAHEAQALHNHDQTLERLAERGGLGEGELVAILEDRKWKAMDREDATRKIHELLAIWLATHG